MCIIFFIVREKSSASPYRLILASNRDENYKRPTMSASVWEEDSSVIAGKDLQPGREGGTWLGISANSDRIKVGALLNIPGEKNIPEDAANRGPIVTNYLRGDLSVFDYSDQLLRSKVLYSAFNFISIELNTKENADHCFVYHTSNAPRSIEEFPNNQVLGFSNSPWNSPLQKVDRGKLLFQDVIAKDFDKDELVNNLMEMLKDTQPFPEDPEIRSRIPNEGRRVQLSSIHVDIPEVQYGTRTRTVILIDFNNNVDYFEETLLEDGAWKKSHILKKLQN